LFAWEPWKKKEIWLKKGNLVVTNILLNWFIWTKLKNKHKTKKITEIWKTLRWRIEKKNTKRFEDEEYVKAMVFSAPEKEREKMKNREEAEEFECVRVRKREREREKKLKNHGVSCAWERERKIRRQRKAEEFECVREGS